jgi:hypothetical protein
MLDLDDVPVKAHGQHHEDGGQAEADRDIIDLDIKSHILIQAQHGGAEAGTAEEMLDQEGVPAAGDGQQHGGQAAAELPDGFINDNDMFLICIGAKESYVRLPLEPHKRTEHVHHRRGQDEEAGGAVGGQQAQGGQAEDVGRVQAIQTGKKVTKLIKLFNHTGKEPDYEGGEGEECDLHAEGLQHEHQAGGEAWGQGVDELGRVEGAGRVKEHQGREGHHVMVQ